MLCRCRRTDNSKLRKSEIASLLIAGIYPISLLLLFVVCCLLFVVCCLFDVGVGAVVVLVVVGGGVFILTVHFLTLLEHPIANRPTIRPSGNPKLKMCFLILLKTFAGTPYSKRSDKSTFRLSCLKDYD